MKKSIFKCIIILVLLLVVNGIMISLDTVYAEEKLLEQDSLKEESVLEETNTLHYSTVYGEWDDSYENYNCYAYAIDYLYTGNSYNTSLFPGQISGEIYYLLPIEQLANLVRNDLITLGYEDIYVTNKRPTGTVLNEKVICIRRGDESFHFMKYHSEGNFWTHKPGKTMILKYNYQPSNDIIWTSEYVDKNGVYHADNYIHTYTSEIY